MVHNAWIFLHLICQPKKCIIHETLDQQLFLNHIIFIFDPYNHYLTPLLYQMMFFSKIHPAENGLIRAIPENLPFFLDVTFKLFQHFSGLFDIKYQMSWCIEHEKCPNCVRLCTVVSAIDNLFVTVDRNTLYICCVWSFNNGSFRCWRWQQQKIDSLSDYKYENDS